MKYKLIDLKICNYCNYNCPFCIQKNKDNKDVSYDKVIEFIDGHKSLTYEFVLVGGDVILYPDLEKILDYGLKNDLKISFMTKSQNWIKDRPNLLDKAFSVGFSIDKLTEIKKLNEFDLDNYVNKIYINLIVGWHDEDEFTEILNTIHESIFKNLVLILLKGGVVKSYPNFEKIISSNTINLYIHFDYDLIKKYKTYYLQRINNNKFYGVDGYKGLFFNLIENYSAIDLWRDNNYIRY